MTTKLIGVKEFRKNMSKLSKGTKRKSVCYIIMNHSVPLWKVEPVEDKDNLIDELLLKRYDKQMQEALGQYKKDGKSYTSEELRASLGL